MKCEILCPACAADMKKRQGDGSQHQGEHIKYLEGFALANPMTESNVSVCDACGAPLQPGTACTATTIWADHSPQPYTPWEHDFITIVSDPDKPKKSPFDSHVESVVSFNWKGRHIPEHMAGGIARYLESGIDPGPFMSAVINNDLRGAFENADDLNTHLVDVYVAYFYNHAPIGSWGFAGATERWNSKVNNNDH